MFIDWKTARIFVRPGATDMRKQINSEEAAREIRAQELKMLLAGIGFWRAHQRLSYTNEGAGADPSACQAGPKALTGGPAPRGDGPRHPRGGESLRVRRHIRLKYACRACEGFADGGNPAVRIAPAVPQLIAKSIARPSVVAYLLTAKFCDALPFYRQEQGFARMGVAISRQDMANWTTRVACRVQPLPALLRQEIPAGPEVGIDETTVQVLCEDGKADTSQSYMWVFLGGQPGRPVVDYPYHPSRSARVPLKALSGYRGFIQTDGYEGCRRVGPSARCHACRLLGACTQ